MTDQIRVEDFRACLTAVLDETFSDVHGIFLDRGNSMFETLATISAEEASRPVGGGCASIAAQVNHVTYYLDIAAQFARGEGPEHADWDSSWEVGPVDDEA